MGYWWASILYDPPFIAIILSVLLLIHDVSEFLPGFKSSLCELVLLFITLLWRGLYFVFWHCITLMLLNSWIKDHIFLFVAGYYVMQQYKRWADTRGGSFQSREWRLSRIWHCCWHRGIQGSPSIPIRRPCSVISYIYVWRISWFTCCNCGIFKKLKSVEVPTDFGVFWVVAYYVEKQAYSFSEMMTLSWGIYSFWATNVAVEGKSVGLWFLHNQWHARFLI